MTLPVGQAVNARNLVNEFTVKSGMRKVFITALTCATILLSATTLAAEGVAVRNFPRDHAAALVVDSAGHKLMEQDSGTPMIPASTMKLLTALISLETLGDDYRFTTPFFYDAATQLLWVVGRGDPFLISEELDLIVTALNDRLPTEVRGVGVDSSYFERPVLIDGQSDSDNPYDATVAAVAANFNTLNVRIDNNSVESAEPQTPLTPTAITLARQLGNGSHRINLGSSREGLVYFAELLWAKLKPAAAPEKPRIVIATVPNSAERILMHESSKTLSEVVRAMLEYSNNFIANQLFLSLGAHQTGAPATMDKSRQVVDQYVRENFPGWQSYRVVEGAGLSRNNRLSAQQLADVLDHLSQRMDLLPAQNELGTIRAKSGTLSDTNTYAGYLLYPDQTLRFVIMRNHTNSNRQWRETMAAQLWQQYAIDCVDTSNC